MNKVNILDCTLRDGGYVVDFNFGKKAIKNIISQLSAAHIDIIECGFLQSGADDPDKTLFGSVSAVKKYIKNKEPGILYVAMIAYGDISIDEIEPNDHSGIEGIRLTFHYNQVQEAIRFGEQLKQKGYLVFMQPVGTMSYDDTSLIDLIVQVNNMNPFAFYIVDTLGTMYSKDLMRIFYLYDNNLNEDIMIGFHSHNNLQLSFANSIELMKLDTKRKIIIDSSIHGMGRAAGNLCTEICSDYINKNISTRYDIVCLMEIIDEYINDMFNKNPWGYSIPYFVSAMHSCHPNYSSYLINKQTLSVRDINTILSRISSGKKFLFDRKYIEKLYIDYQEHTIDDSGSRNEIRALIGDKRPVILAPGRSLKTESERIKAFIDENCFVISVNFIPDEFDADMLFMSNMRRLKSIDSINPIIEKGIKVVMTSNIRDEKDTGCIIMNYSDYINNEYCISDNAGLMLLNILDKINIKEVYLAGFDGFGVNNGYNVLSTDTEKDSAMKNQRISERLKELSKTMKIEFLTNSEYTK